MNNWAKSGFWWIAGWACALGWAGQAGAEPSIGRIVTLPGSAVGIHGRATPGRTVELESALGSGESFGVVAGSGRTCPPDGEISWSVELIEPRGIFRLKEELLPKQLLTWADVEAGLAGTFVLPMAQEGDFRFGYSSGVHVQLGDGTLLVTGHPYFDRQARVALPSVLDGREAARVGPWVDLTQGLLPTGWDGGPAYGLGGILEIDDRIYFTKNQWYNGAGADWETQGYYEGAYDGTGAASGMWRVDGTHAHHQRVGGYMSYAPADVLADGFTYLAGLEGTSGAALGRWGPNLFAIQAAPQDGALPSAPLICHPEEARQPAGWWIANKVTDAEWIETPTHHAVLFFVIEGLGQKWYGEPSQDGLADPYGGGKGYHAEGWTLNAWIYDPQDLLAVFHGERDPWSLTPAEQTVLTQRDPGAGAETHHSFLIGAANADLHVSLRNGRLVILQPGGHQASTYERTPKGYALNLP